MRAEAARAAPRVVAVAWRVDRREEEEARQAGVRVVGVVGAEAAPVAAAPMAARLAALRIPQRIARSPSRGHPRGHDGSSAEPTRPLHATAARFRQARATGAADRTRAEWTRHSASSGSVEFVSPGRNELPTERHRVYKREYADWLKFSHEVRTQAYTHKHTAHTQTHNINNPARACTVGVSVSMGLVESPTPTPRLCSISNLAARDGVQLHRASKQTAAETARPLKRLRTLDPRVDQIWAARGRLRQRGRF